MENQEKQVQFKMKINSINVLRFSQYEIEDIDPDKLADIEYQSDFGIKALPDTSEVAVQTTLKIKIQELNCYFGELKVQMNFHISPFDNVIKRTDTGFKLPDILTYNLFNILSGTLRGVLHEKLKGTILQNEVFPLIDIKDLIIKEVK